MSGPQRPRVVRQWFDRYKDSLLFTEVFVGVDVCQAWLPNRPHAHAQIPLWRRGTETDLVCLTPDGMNRRKFRVKISEWEKLLVPARRCFNTPLVTRLQRVAWVVLVDILLQKVYNHQHLESHQQALTRCLTILPQRVFWSACEHTPRAFQGLCKYWKLPCRIQKYFGQATGLPNGVPKWLRYVSILCLVDKQGHFAHRYAQVGRRFKIICESAGPNASGWNLSLRVGVRVRVSSGFRLVWHHVADVLCLSPVIKPRGFVNAINQLVTAGRCEFLLTTTHLHWKYLTLR